VNNDTETARRYHEAQLSNLIRDFKRVTTRIAKLEWQRNFFDHRLRHDESEDEKAAYIRQNPLRAGLIEAEDDWPFAFDSDDLDRELQR
jgi:putative transposase